MNAKQVLIAAAITFAGSAAFAVEATQFDPEPSTLTRAQVKAELAQARMDGTLMSRGEVTEFHDTVVSTRSVAEVRAEARIAAHEHKFNELYVGA
jgi:hypothetical protein